MCFNSLCLHEPVHNRPQCLHSTANKRLQVNVCVINEHTEGEFECEIAQGL